MEGSLFFSAINKYPFESFYLFHEGTSNKIKNALRIKKTGAYQIIYTDYYKNVTDPTYFAFRKTSNRTNLSFHLNKTNEWTPITINFVTRFNSGEYLTIFLGAHDTKAILDGSSYSTFFIKYLHP